MEVKEQTQKLDLEAIRQKLSGNGGKRYWRSLEQVAETPEFQNWLDDEFPHRRSLLEIDRRSSAEAVCIRSRSRTLNPQLAHSFGL